MMASHLGLVARHDHPYVADVLLRLQQFYTGNYCYLDLLRQVNLAALREARTDEEVLRSNPSFGPISEEIEELKRSAREAREQLAAMPSGSLARVRRKLAPTPVGKAWRLAKRVRRELAPTPAGRAYRLAKRVARTFLGWGRRQSSRPPAHRCYRRQGSNSRSTCTCRRAASSGWWSGSSSRRRRAGPNG